MNVISTNVKADMCYL